MISTLKFITGHQLNSQRKLRAILNYLKWQFGSRLISGTVVYDWVNGSKFFVKRGDTGLTGNIYTGLHEFQDMAFLLHYLRAEDSFVDVGANLGSYTILACSAVGAKGVAYEPIPSTYTKLVENMRLNHLDNKVAVLNKGVGAQKSEILFTSNADTTNHALAVGEQSNDSVSVEVTSLDLSLSDELLASEGGGPALIKIDVEGYETPVLQGAHETLKNPSLNAVIMELNGSGRHYGFDESKLLELMASYGFKTYSYDPFSRQLINLQGKNLTQGNTLFIRNKSAVEKRLQSACNIEVNGNVL